MGKDRMARTRAKSSGKAPEVIDEHVLEVISDSGEGAQKCGQSFASIAAAMGNGVWTVEIIPAEIQPPARSIAGASGIRVRIGAGDVRNGGDAANLVVSFNEKVLLGRIDHLASGCIVLIENKWRTHANREIADSYAAAHAELVERGHRVYEVPIEVECRKHIDDPRRGKNMFALGLLCRIYGLDRERARRQVATTFASKSEEVIATNQRLLDAGWEWARANLDLAFRISAAPIREPRLVVNGNTALALGVMASGMDVCAMYPITPATSVSHYLSEAFERMGGIVHQAEDEIAACAFAIGASYAGRCAVTITSGPGYSLKQESIGLAVMAEIPLVVINVQRGGPSTGQPTKAEQGDLLAACFGSHGDAPKVVMATSDVEDCFHSVITARKIAETLRTVVVLLSDASLATAQQPFPRPKLDDAWLAPPVDQSPVPEGAAPYDWDERTGLAPRFVPGRPGGMHTVTGLAHDRESHVAYAPTVNEDAIRHRSQKLIAFQKTLRPPPIFGDPEGDLLVVGWGSTKGAIEEAVARVRAEGHRVSSMHLRFLQPMAPGIRAAMQRFERVMTAENNWCDRPGDGWVDEDNRRYSNLGWLLRARCLVDIDCWGQVRGEPLSPGLIESAIRERLGGTRS